ncbi:hypothetical protein ET08_85 [Mycobacterium phage ET08]|uniref:Uncharacterized protein n=1 Tax=Mycobacterium phage ET08 TaxID=663554 RepID=C9DAR0_9CAUD|nr:hypothetical protein ET08_85 [Mycobacterium phage ET08]ACU41328.1 hypothetical protein ET08_85 [Mycobacterium phage ET08]QPL13430.1 LysM-like peptidoglycan binding protein [Mycobacterium phage StephanieG]
MATVYTEYGPGEIIASETVRGRTQHQVRVAGYGEIWIDETKLGIVREAWAPLDHDNSVSLPYDPSPQYPALPGDTESTIQPIHEIDADERLSPADSITFEDRSDDESIIDGHSDNFAKSAAYGDPTTSEPGYSHGLEWDAPERSEYAHPDFKHFHDDQYEEEDPLQQAMAEEDGAPDWHPSDQYGDLNKPYPADTWRGSHPDLPGHMASSHEAAAFLIPLMGAGAGAAGAGAAGAGAAGAGGAGAGLGGALAGGVARGVGMGAAEQMLGGGGDPSQQGGGPVDQAIDAIQPGPGWGELQKGASLDQWLSGQDQGTGTAAGLGDRYIDVTAAVDPSDPISMFRHDPVAYISRTGHVHDEPVSEEMQHYGQLIEANPQIREAAWKDVRAKAMRLRREGRVHVKDVAPDRIYASVDGDHGTYEVMIAKGGAFGGLGGGHAISNWRCACEWGKWAFQRRMTYVGRLCSHGYAAYLTMQSEHMKGKPSQRRRSPYRKRADALQNGPQRLVPELAVNDLDDAHTFLDVTEDERKETGPDDIVSEKDIVHFSRLMAKCDAERLPYPRTLVAFLERYADDQSKADWKIEDTGKAGPALEELRDWADTSQEDYLGNMEERVEDIRDAVDTAREHGVDASQLTAGVHFRTAAPKPEVTSDGSGGKIQQTRQFSRDPGTSISDWLGVGGTPGAAGTRSNGAGQSMNQSRDSGGVQDTDSTQAKPGGGGFDPNMNDRSNRPVSEGGGATNGTPAGWSAADAASPGSNNGPHGAAGSATNPTPGQPGNNTPAAPGAAPKNNLAGPAGTNTPSATPPGGGQIGQGEYQIQSGDTLSDIAQRAGYGGDYNSLAQQNNIADPDKIFAGDTINIGTPGGGATTPDVDLSAATPGGGADANNTASDFAGTSTSGATDATGTDNGTSTPADNAAAQTTTETNKTGRRRRQAAPSGSSATPAQSTTPDSEGLVDSMDNPAAPTGGTPASNTALSSPNNDLGDPSSAIDTGASTGGTPDATGAGTDASTPGGFDLSQFNDTISGIGDAVSTGVGIASDIAGGVGDVVSGIGSIFSSRQDYDDWHRYAYPEAGDHKPFAGSGPQEPLKFTPSTEYADKARRKMDDVTDLDYDHSKPVNPRQSSAGGGIQRAGRGARRTVEPVVVREQRPGGRVAAQQPHVPDDFDPLAPRTAASFDDPYDAPDVDQAAMRIAANTEGDIVAAFQRSAGAEAIMSSSGGGASQYDDFSSSPAVIAAMQRTAGRHYSPSEQAELIREGDRGGAGNLDALDLRGTHYEAEHSVGLW